MRFKIRNIKSEIGTFKAVSYLWFGSLLGAAFAFFSQVLIARKLSLDEYGSFSSALALVNIVLPLAGFGLPQLWLKVFGEEGWRGIRWIKPSLQFAILSTTCVSGGIVVWGIVGGHGAGVDQLFGMLALFLIGQVSIELVSSRLQLEERYRDLSAWQLCPHVLRFFLVLAFLYFSGQSSTLYGVGLVYGGVGLLFAIVSMRALIPFLRGKFNLVGHGGELTSKRESSPGILGVLYQAAPFGLAGMLHFIYYQGAILLLAYLDGPAQAGVYNIAFVIMSAVYLFPSVVYQKYLMPKLHRWRSQSPEIFFESYKLGSLYMFGLGVAASAAVLLLAPVILPLLFGDGYDESVRVLQLLALCAPLRFMATSVGSVLMTHKYMMIKVKCMAVVALISVSLGIFLIPVFSIWGAIVTAFLSEAALLALYYGVARFKVFNDKSGNANE